MGLAERKLVQAAKDIDFKNFEQNLNKVCGFLPKVDIDWSALENHKDCVWAFENKEQNTLLFDPIIEALKSVCSDEMGKTALREGLKAIKISFAAGELEFSKGTLFVRSDIAGMDGAWDFDAIKTKLEKGL